jgi:hypothetical protein
MSDVSQGPGWWLASDGKWYPPQQQPGYQPPPPAPPQKKRHGCLLFIGGAVVVVVLLGVVLAVLVVAVASKSTSKASSSLGGPPPGAAYKIGDTANTSGLRVTVYAVKNPQPPTNSLLTPQTGDHFVSVDVQVTNPSADQQAFSSLIAFHLLDAQNRQYDEDITGAGLNPGAPDGQIAGGQSIRGFVVFQIPNGTTGLKLRVQGSLTAAGAVFTL